MKDQWEQESASLKAEVAALRQQVHELLAAQPARANPPAPWRVSKSLKLLLSVCLLLAASGVLYGQGAIDALFIDQQGRVGIGKTDPQTTLDVAGNVNITGPLTAESLRATKGATLKAPLKIESTDARGVNLDIGGEADNANLIPLQLRNGNTINEVNYRGSQITFGFNNTDTYRHAIQTRHNDKGQGGNAIDFFVWKYDAKNVNKAEIGGLHTLTLESGKVGIGTKAPQATLDVKGGALAQSLSFTDGNGNLYADNWIGMANNIEGATKWLHIGGITDGDGENRQRRIALYANTTYIDGNVGIWTKDPKAKLDVNGFILGRNPRDRNFRDNEGAPSDSARAKDILASKPDGTFMLAGPNKNHPNYFIFYWKSDGKYYRGWIGGEGF